jgi:tRNA-2-methylthio-N6-dimethylallyladenosine synthase
MDDEVLRTVAELPKLCEHIEVPVQAGDDEILARMKRGYTTDDYRHLIERIRRLVPGASIATDIIVGFPSETRAQFERTYQLLAELRLAWHTWRATAAPPAPWPRAASKTTSPRRKRWTARRLEDLQAGIAEALNRQWVGRTQGVGEALHKGRWKAYRATTVWSFDADGDWRGRLAQGGHVRPPRGACKAPWPLDGPRLRHGRSPRAEFGRLQPMPNETKRIDP